MAGKDFSLPITTERKVRISERTPAAHAVAEFEAIHKPVHLNCSREERAGEVDPGDQPTATETFAGRTPVQVVSELIHRWAGSKQKR